jgi:HK97 family phage prohead protease
MLTKNCGITLDTKAVGDDGRIAGYASAFGVVDSYGERVMPGAFKKSLLAAKREKRSIKMLYQHDTYQPIGVWDELEEDSKGLHVEGRLLKDVSPKAAEVYGLVKEGALDELSIGYREIKTGPAKDLPQVIDLMELNLREASIVTFGALGRAAHIDEIKATLDAGKSLTIREFEGFLRDAGFSRSKAEAMAAACKPHLRGEPEGKADDDMRRFLDRLRA